MARSEWSELLRVLDASAHEREPDASLLAVLMQGFGVGEQLDTSLLPRLAPPVPAGARGVDEIAATGRTLPVVPDVQPISAPRSASQPESSGSGAAGVLKTIGTATGVGPIVTGLLKLFGGSSDESAAAAAPLPFSLPEQISVEAGLAADRSFVPVAYSQRGVARSVAAQGATSSLPAQVLVNVQAIDSRSFLDHSDDIARAVRDAMLRSHALNDVVAEL